MNRKLLLDKKYLEFQYWKLNLTLEQLSRLINCSRGTVKNHMIRHGIPIRKQHHHLEVLNSNFEHQSKAGKCGAAVTNKLYSHLASKRMRENNVGYLMHIKWKEKDLEGYRQHQRTAGINGGKIGGLDPHKAWKERDLEGYIEHQKNAGKIRGQQLSQSPYNHPLFDAEFYEKYGMMKSQYPYPKQFFKVRQQIIDRDRNICNICGIKYPNNFAIHHIDNNKLNNNPSNLVFLCQDCHNKKTRGYKGKYYQIFLEKLNH